MYNRLEIVQVCGVFLIKGFLFDRLSVSLQGFVISGKTFGVFHSFLSNIDRPGY
jgi:hypothetical protein